MRITTLLLGLASLAANAQNVITPWWGTPFPDGTFASGEWDAAPTVSLPTGTGHTCTVAVACDQWGLYFAFMGYLETAYMFPEMLIDAAHDRSADWNSDDHWYHVSASACHHVAGYGVYDGCTPFPLDWSAHPLILPGIPGTDSMEVAIPWSMLGITPQAGDTIGLGLVLTNTVTSWNNWPSGSAYWSPATWGHLVIPGAVGVAEISHAPRVRLWPNPASDVLRIEFTGPGPFELELLDAMGRIVWVQRTGDARVDLGLEALPQGPYTIRIRDPKGSTSRAFIRM